MSRASEYVSDAIAAAQTSMQLVYFANELLPVRAHEQFGVIYC